MVCTHEFTPRTREHKFCSRPCLYKFNRGANAPNWKGGRFVDDFGYVQIRMPDHPRVKAFFGESGYMREHVVVMEQHLGRYLRKDESVHHINGQRADNRIENLQLRQRHHGFGHVARCGDCGSKNIVHIPISGEV